MESITEIKILQLYNGSCLIGYITAENENYVTIEDSRSVNIGMNRSGKVGCNFGPPSPLHLILTKDVKKMDIIKSQIMFTANEDIIPAELVKEYRASVSGIVTPNNAFQM